MCREGAFPNIVKKAAGEWAIEARAFPIPFTPFTHNFWVLADTAGRAVDQIHGLAIDRVTGISKAIGSCRDLLQAVRSADIGWSLRPGQPVAVCASGPAGEIGRRWQAAADAVPVINALELPYPGLWQHFYKCNSNTVFSTIGRIMGFDDSARLLGTWAPGAGLVISEELIDKYGYKLPSA